MNIGFYGHSNCAYRSPESFLDIVANHFNANIVNIGVKQGSEERVLFEIKKTKNLDLAIIFHCPKGFLFLPGCDRDIGISNMSRDRSEYLFDSFSRLYNKEFIDKFNNADTFWQAFQNYKLYFHHPDLHDNRYYGALSQIDSFISAKKIPCIHVISELPEWFRFSSGIIDYDISKIIKDNPQDPGSFFANCISREGNKLVADKLIEVINKCISA